MIRTALRPRWLALLGVVLIVCAGFGWMGAWQLDVARDRGAAQQRAEVSRAPRVAVEQVLQPQRGFPTAADGRRVSVQGAYDARRHVLVADRVQDGRRGWWVVTAVRTSQAAWLPVVRGWVASPRDAAAAPGRVPTGPVLVEGVLQADDAPATARTERPPGQLAALDASELANLWGTPIYNAFLILTGERGSGAIAGQPQRVPPPPLRQGPLSWRNTAYAVQWWVFAGFALVLWWKMVAQEARARPVAVDAGGTA